MTTPKQPSERERDLEDELLAEIPRVRGFLRRLAGQEAEDLVQEVLERAVRYGASFDPAGSLRGWLLKTAFRVFLDHRDRAARRPESLGDRAALLPGGAQEGRLEARDEVERLLAGLTPVEKNILLRFHRDGWSTAEIARDAGLPVGTVKSHLHRARRKIARRSSGAGTEEER